jgi:hypothetical protein
MLDELVAKKHLPLIVNSIAPLVWNSKTDKWIYPSSQVSITKMATVIHSHIKVQTSLCWENLQLIASVLTPKNVDTTDAEMPKKVLDIIKPCSLVHHVNSSIKFETAHWAVTCLIHKLPRSITAANKHLQTEQSISRASSSFLNFPNTHLYQLRVASLYKYEFWDSRQSNHEQKRNPTHKTKTYKIK